MTLHNLRQIALLATFGLWAGTAAARSVTASPGLGSGAYAIGAAAWPTPALSVRLATHKDTAWHTTVRYGDEGAGFSGDYHRVFVPEFGRHPGNRISLYTGIGLQGESHQEEDGVETYHLRFPAGAQWDVLDLHLQAFLEGAGLVGELPETRLQGAYMGGLRATF